MVFKHFCVLQFLESPTLPPRYITAEWVRAKLQLEKREIMWNFTTGDPPPPPLREAPASTRRLFFLGPAAIRDQHSVPDDKLVAYKSYI